MKPVNLNEITLIEASIIALNNAEKIKQGLLRLQGKPHSPIADEPITEIEYGTA